MELLPIDIETFFKRLARDKKMILAEFLLFAVFTADYLLTKNLNKDLGILIVLAFTVVMAIVYSPIMKRRSSFNGLMTVIGSLHALMFVMLIFVLPLDSHYVDVIYVIIYAAQYWYGYRGFILSFLTILISMEIAVLYQTGGNVSEQTLYEFAVRAAMFGLIAAMLQRMSAVISSERTRYIEISEEASFERQRLRSLINSMGDAVIATNTEGIIKIYNGATLELLNTNLSLENQPLSNYIAPMDENRKDVDLLAEAESSGFSISRSDLTFRNNQAELVNIYVSVSPIHLSYGVNGEEGFILLLRDITKEKSIEEQRDDFVSIVSHELRTPLAIAEANISTAMLPDILNNGEKAQSLLDQAHKNIIFLSSLVDDITTLAHAERGDIDSEMSKVDSKKLFEEMASDYKTKAAEKDLDFHTSFGEDVPKRLFTNEHRLKEILQDFITNAIKYTEQGAITFSLKREEKNAVIFSVTDTGIGLSTSDRKKVFEKFYRAENPETRAHSGTGLGLYIAWKLAKLIGGQVGVDSQLGKGSTFWLRIPTNHDAHQQQQNLDEIIKLTSKLKAGGVQ